MYIVCLNLWTEKETVITPATEIQLKMPGQTTLQMDRNFKCSTNFVITVTFIA